MVFEPVSTIRFGGGRVRAPHYDLDGLTGSWMIDRLVDGTTTPSDAVLGPARPSPAWDPAPALAFLHRPGVAVPEAEFRFSTSVAVDAVPEGASRFVLPPEALSGLREDAADLRIVDADSRQWPYLVTGRPSVRMPLTIASPSRAEQDTRYALGLPVGRATMTELRLVADAELVSRAVRVVGIDLRGDEVTLGRGMLERAPGQLEPMTLALSSVRVSDLTLIVTDGDESPLVFSSVEAALTSREIFLVAPPGDYRALLGDDDAIPPAYDIERARELVVAIPVAEAELGSIAANPAFHEPGLMEGAGAQTLGLWVVLVLAVLVLGGLTWRASREPAPEPEAKAEAAPAASEGSEPGDPSA